MRLFKTKWFARYARQEKITDASLRDAVSRAERGLIDADLGGHIIKQRLARAGQGRSGGYRVLLGFRPGDRAVFVFGFAKSERENITTGELAAAREIVALWLKADDAALDREIDLRNLIEVKYDN